MKKSYIRTKNLELTGEQTDELIILVRRELQELDKLKAMPGYEKHRQRRIQIMNHLHDQLMADDFTVEEVEE